MFLCHFILQKLYNHFNNSSTLFNFTNTLKNVFSSANSR